MLMLRTVIEWIGMASVCVAIVVRLKMTAGKKFRFLGALL